jgi:hypothetical protein
MENTELFSDCKVQISFMKKETRCPIFDLPSGPLVLNVSNLAIKGQMISQLKILPVGGSTPKVTFEVIDGDSYEHFSVEKDSGWLSVERIGLQRSHYWLIVQASIASNPHLFTNQHVVLMVMQSRQKPPYFNPSVYYKSIHDGQGVGQSIVQLYAQDDNRKFSTGHLEFKIREGNRNKAFKISR